MTFRNRDLISLFAAAMATALLVSPASGQIKGQSLVGNLAYPLGLAQPPNDSSRLFIVGQQGAIRILEGGSLKPQPFLDVTSEVLFGGEQGLLSLAFDPDYDTNGYFYIYFIAGSGNGVSVVRRYQVSANPDSADGNSGHTVLTFPQLATNHNGATVLFGPDGYLWLGFGDSGQAPLAQDPQSLFGKMLRLDPSGDDYPADPDRNYAIPPDNPFVGDPTTLDEIWAFGLRNPWRFSFDRLTGDLYIGDVGHYEWEEISFEPAGSPGGLNFGWPLMEGPVCHIPPVDCNDGSLTLPIHTWPHVACNSGTGGYVYRGTELAPWLYGHYFFADYCQPGLWSFRFDSGSGTYSEFTDWGPALDLDGTLRYPASFFEDHDGELYIVEYRSSIGEIWKIVPDSTVVGAPLARGPVSPAGLRLGPASPNPFDRSTRFEVHGGGAADLDVTIYSAAGRLVRRLHSGPAGDVLSLAWDARDESGIDVPNGVYFLRAESARRVTLLR